MDSKQLRDGDFFDTLGTLFKAITPSMEALKLNIWTFLLLAVIPGAILLLAVFLAFIPLLAASNGSDVVVGVGAFFVFVLSILALLAALVFAPAIIQTQIASVKDQKVEFNEAFNKAKPFVLRFIGLGLLAGLVIFVGLLLLIVPGLLAIFFFSYAGYVLVDKNVGVVDSLKASYELAKEYWKVTLGLVLVNIAISIVGYVPLIGGLASIVLTIAYFCLPAIVYTAIAGKKTAVAEAEVVKKKK